MVIIAWMKYTADGTLHWFIPIHDLLPSGERTEDLIATKKVFGFKNSLSISRKMKAGGVVCFYSLEKGSFVFGASIKSGPFLAPFSISVVYPLVVELDQVIRIAPTTSVTKKSVRNQLDAFKGNTKTPWGWFVRRPQHLSQHDFEFLTEEKGGPCLLPRKDNSAFRSRAMKIL